MNRIITAIDEEILELDAKAAKLRMLRQAAVSIEEDGPVALEAVEPRELEPGVAAAEATQAALDAERAARLSAVTPAPDPEPESAPPPPPADPEADERVYAAIAAAKGAWIAVGPALGEEIGVSRHHLKTAKERLLDAGRIARKGRHRGTRFRATAFPEPPESPTGLPKPETAESDRRKAANIGKAKQVDDRLVAMAEEAGVDGVAGTEVATALDITPASARARLIRGVETGRLVSFDGEGGGKRYRSKALGLLPADVDGCKTNVERNLLEAVRRAPVALTTVEVAANAKVAIVDAGRVLHGMAKRGIVRAIPLKTETSPQRWELPKVMAEAA